jgi:YVTN family beta-propeller protein
MSRLLALMFCLVLAAPLRATDLPYVNWENHPVHALDLSPDRSLLAVAHTADQRVQFFDVSQATPVAVGHVLVGVDPVSVRFRNAGELWVVNHISDSVSVIDVATRRVRATLATADEPFDVVFAGNRAFVSCSQANQVLVFDTNDLSLEPTVVPIAAEDPRALAVSADGRSVVAAIFESGNATTILSGGLLDRLVALPNTVSDSRGPYGGQNPPPNVGSSFDPPINPAAPPPPVGLIVRRDAQGRWRDDNIGDWTEFVSGSLSTVSGRRAGWDLVDRDLAIIDVDTLSVRYVTGLMNIGMALAINPATGEATLVGTEAFNEVRFEPNVKSRFVHVEMARASLVAGGAKSVRDLNPHLNYVARSVPQAERDRSIGDPRAIVWRADGQRGWVAGLGSNNVIVIDANGARVGNPIGVGEGPVGLALDGVRDRLYVWNHFEASLSVVNSAAGQEISRTPVFNPLPAAIRNGRPLLYDTHRTSGLGQVSCGSCHVDGRMDRLAWDLGDPSQPPQAFDQNCITVIGSPACANYHAMKGPMTTQTMQDIIGHEPLHWRGDRAGIEAFNPAFEGLLGDDTQLTGAQMQAFEDFLATITFPPNPNRNLDNTLPATMPLPGHYTSGRFQMAGIPLGSGSATRGLQLYTTAVLDGALQCASCHTLPTGMAVNGPLFLGVLAVPVGGSVMPIGPMGENHLGIVSTDGSTNVSMKVPQLRNQYEKTGFEMTQTDNVAGFGFLHDGSVDSLSKFLSARVFRVGSDQDVADLIALTLAFSGSDFGNVNPILGAPAPQSKDTHAAVGAQVTLTSAAVSTRAEQLLNLARSGKVDLIARSGTAGYAFDVASDNFLSNDGSPALTPAGLQASASSTAPLTLTLVPRGLGERLGIDRDGDGLGDGVEIRQGSNPADANSVTLKPMAGLWYNAARSGHGMDLQFAGDTQFVTWYTYNDDGSATWYQAVASRANPWVAELKRYTWNGSAAVGTTVGQMRLDFADAGNVSFGWTLGSRSGTEPMQAQLAAYTPSNPNRNGTWYTAGEPGWGFSLYTGGDTRVGIIYFYDGNQQPRWVLGQGSNAAVERMNMASYQGFCPDCTAIAPTSGAAGFIDFSFDGARLGSASTDVYHAGTGSSHWRRGPVAIEPLSDVVTHPLQY